MWKSVGVTVTNANDIREEIKHRINFVPPALQAIET